PDRQGRVLDAAVGLAARLHCCDVEVGQQIVPLGHSRYFLTDLGFDAAPSPRGPAAPAGWTCARARRPVYTTGRRSPGSGACRTEAYPMITIHARKALLTDGWAERVRLTIVNGLIGSVEKEADAEQGDVRTGILIPGVCNAHSHAFQRALAGHTEERASGNRDNFWSWRSRMYRLAARIDADALTAVARQLYSEMLCSGYTSVAEFHYLHREPGCKDDRNG